MSHHFLKLKKSSNFNPWSLLVGAPTYNNGTVYNCDLIEQDCNQIQFGTCELPTPNQNDDKGFW